MKHNERTCQHCGGRIPYYFREDAKYCGGPCRQAAYRARKAESDTPSSPDVTPRVELVVLR